MDDADAMREFAELFKATYLRFHRRRERNAAYTSQQWAVLTHLALTGPLTAGCAPWCARPIRSQERGANHEQEAV